MPITWGGPVATFRVDNSNDFDFKNLSVREIQGYAVPTTTATPPGGTYSSPQLVTLFADEPSVIHFAIDDIVTLSSETYVNPILISDNSTLNFFAVDTDGNQESVKTEIYTIFDLPTVSITFDNSNNTICSSMVWRIVWLS